MPDVRVRYTTLKIGNEVVIVDPGHGFHSKFTRKMESLDYSQSQEKHEIQIILKSILKAGFNLFQIAFYKKVWVGYLRS